MRRFLRGVWNFFAAYGAYKAQVAMKRGFRY
jgi:hypothetical protein